MKMPEPTTNPHCAASVDKLISIAEEVTLKLQRVDDLKRLWKGFETLYANGVEEYNKGDEKMAFIYFYRCFMCYECSKAPKHSQNNQCRDYKAIYGSNIRKAIEMLDKLKEKFEKSLHETDKGLRHVAIKASETKESLKMLQEDDINSIVSDAKSSDNASVTNVLEGITLKNNKNDLCSYISSKELYAISAEDNLKSPSILILDIRLKEDFDKSTLKLDDVINIPENIIMLGNTATKLESSLEERFKPFFRKRGDYDHIVIVDWSSNNVIHGSKIFLLLSILTKWDQRTKYNSKPVTLRGGFEEWYSTYPNRTTNPFFSPPSETKNNNQFSVDSINYPSFESEKIDTSTPKPTVDRSTKPSAMDKKFEYETAKVEGIEKKSSTIDVGENHMTRIIDANELSKGKKKEVVRKKTNENSENVDKSIQLHSLKDNRPALSDSTNRIYISDSENEDPVRDESRNNDQWGKDDDDDKYQITNPNLTNNIHNENESGSKMKRYSSTPNISEAGLNKDVKPPIDRSTKPSNDDQLNYYTMNSSYIDKGKGLTGLRNIGNTCYMNSIIQCLSNTEPLRKRFNSIDPRKINKESKTRGNVALEVISIMKQLWSNDSGPVSCRSLKNIIGQHNEMFRGYDQQDSHEFLTILIDWLHEDLNEPSPNQNLDGASEKTGEKAWGEFSRKNNSIIKQLFYGQLKSTVSCSVCKCQSITFEPFSNLSLPLPPDERGKCLIEDCLKLYTSNDEVDKWQCPKCKDFRKATKKLDITHLPPLLVVHFKRFTSVGGCKKQKTFVDFPDILDMKPFIIGTEHRDSRFQLYAVSNHSGSMESGHYTAYCKNSIDNRWYQFDDQSVYPSSLIKSKEAYITFYQTMRIEKSLTKTMPN